MAIGLRALLALLLCAPWLLGKPVAAAVPQVGIAASDTEPQVRRVQPAVLVEERGRLAVEQALAAVEDGRAATPDHPVVSRGIGSRPVWLVFDVFNATPEPSARQLTVEIGWLESVEFHQVVSGEVVRRAVGGDGLAVEARDAGGQWPRLDARFPPGETRVLVRVQTADPLLAPLSLTSLAATAAQDRYTWLFYGFVYGAVLVLMAYNFVLFLGLRYRRYLLYTLYLASFLAMNLSYTGLGMVLLWPGAVAWQQWAPVLFMVAFGISGLGFGTRFLGVVRHQPRAYRAIVGLCVVFGLAVPLAMALGWQSRASLLAFTFIPLFSAAMLYIGISALRREKRAALLFVIATLSSVVGAMVSSVTVWGWVPYTRWGFHAVEVGMVLDATLLAVALAEQFRTTQRARWRAEAAARVDPLTGLHNRRGFDAVVPMLWALSERDDRPLSLLMIDLDDFKTVNDRHGHHVGDELLQRIGELLHEHGREGDVAARWGGEEFVVLLPDTDLQAAAVVAERLRVGGGAIGVTAGDSTIAVTLSIGVATRTDAMSDADDLVRHADQQLYRAKQAGRNRVCMAGVQARRLADESAPEAN